MRQVDYQISPQITFSIASLVFKKFATSSPQNSLILPNWVK